MAMNLRKTLQVAAVLVLLLAPSMAMGWGSATHGLIANRVLDHPQIQSWLQYFGFTSADRSTMVSVASGEPDNPTYQWPSWSSIKDRQFHANRMNPNAALTWGFTPFHVGVLLHLAADASVPIGHAPARWYWTNPDGPYTDWAEGLQEIKTWYPPAPDMTMYDGLTTYAEKVNYHESRMADIAQRYEAEFDFTLSGAFAGYNADYFAEGLPLASPLGVIILDDYFEYHNDGPVPEPATVALMVVGLSAIFAARKKKKLQT